MKMKKSLKIGKVFRYAISILFILFVFAYLNTAYSINLTEDKEVIEEEIDIREGYSLGDTTYNIFEDVTPDMYFADAIEGLYKKGIVKGYSETLFGPMNTLTKAEALTLLLRLSGREVDDVKNGIWYDKAIYIAENLSIFRETDDPLEPALRRDIARYICKIYNFDMVNVRNKQIFSDYNSLYANAMYDKGIFIGAEREEGLCFLPDENITRGDMCLVLNRILNTLEPIYPKVIHIGNYDIVRNPFEVEDFYNVIYATLENEEMKVKIPYSKYLDDSVKFATINENIKTAYYYLYGKEPEVFGVYDNLSIKGEHDKGLDEGYVTIQLYSDLGDFEDIAYYNREFRSACEKIVEDCYENDIFDETTSNKEKARYFYKYITIHCRYDFNYTSLSYTGYGAAVDGVAVCQGYVAMFNYLCDLEDIENEAVVGEMKSNKELHTWTKIKFENEWRYCDVTFGDAGDSCDMSYFDMSYEEIMRDRTEVKP